MEVFRPSTEVDRPLLSQIFEEEGVLCPAFDSHMFSYVKDGEVIGAFSIREGEIPEVRHFIIGKPHRSLQRAQKMWSCILWYMRTHGIRHFVLFVNCRNIRLRTLVEKYFRMKIHSENDNAVSYYFDLIGGTNG